MKIRLRYRDNAAEVKAGTATFFRIGTVLLAVVTVALLSALVTMRLAIHTAEVEVPNLSGMTVEEAGDKTGSARLNLTVENRFYSITVPPGRVLSQSPAAGFHRAQGLARARDGEPGAAARQHSRHGWHERA